MAHSAYNAVRTMRITGDLMGAARAQARRMLDGAASLRVSDANRIAASDRLASATVECLAAEARLAASRARLAATRTRIAQN